jgi:hypothetical protein
MDTNLLNLQLAVAQARQALVTANNNLQAYQAAQQVANVQAQIANATQAAAQNVTTGTAS